MCIMSFFQNLRKFRRKINVFYNVAIGLIFYCFSSGTKVFLDNRIMECIRSERTLRPPSSKLPSMGRDSTRPGYSKAPSNLVLKRRAWTHWSNSRCWLYYCSEFTYITYMYDQSIFFLSLRRKSFNMYAMR